MSEILPPAANPCGSCPYRVDVPSGIWVLDEYLKLIEYDKETPFQPHGIFLCHRQDGRVCAGWCAAHDMEHSLAIRVGYSDGRLDSKTFDAIVGYQTSTEVFGSGAEAAQHGIARINNPDAAAKRVMAKMEALRERG